VVGGGGGRKAGMSSWDRRVDSDVSWWTALVVVKRRRRGRRRRNYGDGRAEREIMRFVSSDAKRRKGIQSMRPGEDEDDLPGRSW